MLSREVGVNMKNERLQRLEPYELKDSRTVLRREKMSNHLDLVVKNIFGSPNHPEILISFLNATLKQKKKKLLLKKQRSKQLIIMRMLNFRKSL